MHRVLVAADQSNATYVLSHILQHVEIVVKRAPELQQRMKSLGGYGGSNLRNLEGRGEFEFPRPLTLTPFYRDSIENRQFGGQRSKSSRGNFRGESPPPLAFGTF